GLGLALLLLLAARVGGWPAFWGRLPGKHLVAGFERSVDPTGTTAARWTRGWMGPGNRFGADIDGGNLLSTYGAQQVVREAAPLYYSQQWGLADQQVMTRHSVDFVWVDLRLSRQTPVTGSYFSIDPLAGRHTQPISQEALTKFDAVVGANRLYDNGTIRIYDMRDS
ncbi:MAG TPA: hypothetical protein VJT31_12135, partial [Rugosimonospora sp.]|nr:hypothetical protein [Rugosimonospora sp.]